MQKTFTPDYTHIVDAAYNRRAARLPLYEHGINGKIVKQIKGYDPVEPFYVGDPAYDELRDAAHKFCLFLAEYGYDVFPFETCVTTFVNGGRSLCGAAPGIIQTMRDLETFDWAGLVHNVKTYAAPRFDAIRDALIPGMKLVGGIGNGTFETIQDFTTFNELPFIREDEPALYETLWQKIGDVHAELWAWYLERYADITAVCRFGDDLGFRSSTLIHPDDIRKYVIPQYKRVVDLVHRAGKPFLLHSCGRIDDVMDDLIAVAGIDAKHSNEDAIAPFSHWLDRYGDRIGNFGGIEMNLLCLNTPDEVKAYVTDVCRQSEGHGGVAIGSGNQIADYVKPENFIAMTEAVREYRGE